MVHHMKIGFLPQQENLKIQDIQQIKIPVIHSKYTDFYFSSIWASYFSRSSLVASLVRLTNTVQSMKIQLEIITMNHYNLWSLTKHYRNLRASKASIKTTGQSRSAATWLWPSQQHSWPCIDEYANSASLMWLRELKQKCYTPSVTSDTQTPSSRHRAGTISAM